MKTNTHFWSHLTQFFSEWEMFQTTVVQEILYRKLKHAFHVQFFPLENRDIYGIMGEKLQSRTGHRWQCGAHIHSQYVIHTAFPLQQWLQERASMLRRSPLPVLLTPVIRCIKKQSRSVIDMTYTELKQTHSYVIWFTSRSMWTYCHIWPSAFNNSENAGRIFMKFGY